MYDEIARHYVADPGYVCIPDPMFLGVNKVARQLILASTCDL